MQLDLPGIISKLDESIEFILKHEPPEGYFVGFSGGKDSIVMLDLVRASGVKYEVYYSLTMIDPPEVVLFIRKYYPEVIFLIPDMTFWQGILKKGLPLRMRRWCCDVLKKDPSICIPLKHRIMGIRAEESPRRRSRGRICRDPKKHTTQYAPIFNLNEGEIWNYIEEHNLPYPTLYDEGFSRIGCIFCPFLSKGEVARSLERWPGHWKVLRRVMEKHYEKYQAVIHISKEEYFNWPLWDKDLSVSEMENLFE
jgi:phosphoadenosine phosphosulfate reductase